ncbi:GNAT family N-acetyltransferase [Pseudoalteromonas aurantia]|uniref:N-acetyltransferase n=2 Tax=Pseudoalteromonas TaxID=53246 RepID=A0A5S3VEP7_9GAMM|nr:GNAT family N-acetyltransferase [Pseudoalteromonas aurantia]TMO63619.1 N-acetyltransferase [Pseudoalteromonas aurantia]TMO70264.1 N-acetyltransferase [Pseudoalteromonas aurantia]TMO77373.1 N-acetyltransferase [Pseudoalteromonas aurantia]
MTIRIAEHRDLPAIVAVYNETIASRMVTADTEPTTVEARRQWFFSHTPRRPLFVYESQGVVLAWLSFKSFYGRPAYAGTCEISIYITALARGKGLGTQLLEFAEQYAISIDVDTLLGFIFSHNVPSIKLFERQGYSCWGKLPHIARMDGKRFSLTILGKQLGNG